MMLECVLLIYALLLNCKAVSLCLRHIAATTSLLVILTNVRLPVPLNDQHTN